MDILKIIRKILGSEEDKLIQDIETLKKQVAEMSKTIDELQKSLITKEPIVLGNISFDEILSILNRQATSAYVSDTSFSLTSVAEAKKFVADTKVQFREWKAETHDCDNFSFALQGYWSKGLYSFPFGIAWSSSHAFNFMVDENKQLWIVEPQSNKWYTIEEVKKNPLYYPWRIALC